MLVHHLKGGQVESLAFGPDGRMLVVPRRDHGVLVWDDVSESIKAGTFESRPDRHLAHGRMVLDEEGWAEMAKLLNGVLSEVEKIEAGSRSRLRKSDNGAAIPTTFALMHFESAPRPVHGQES